jgi:hypothetical protein
MKNISFWKRSLLLAFFMVSSMSANAVNLSQLGCDHPYCDEVAEKVDYEKGELVGSVNLRTTHFSLEIPDEPIRRIVSSEEDTIIYYENGQVLIISETRVPDIDNLDKNYAYKFPEVVFTKTSKEVESSDLPETTFMKVAHLQKRFYFSKATQVNYSENEEIGYFVSNSSEMGFSGTAMVSTPKIKDVFLKVDAERMDFGVFKTIVFSAKSGI